MKKLLAVVLLLAVVSTVLVGCDPYAILYGAWSNEDSSLTYHFGKDNKGYMEYVQIPLEFTYTYENGVLTVSYSETLSETGKLTFFGDHEFIWEYENKDGSTTELTYARKAETDS